MAKRDRSAKAPRSDLSFPGDAGTGALESLLDTERRLTERLAAATSDAQELLAAAKVAAGERARIAERELESAIGALREREEAARAAAVTSIDAAARADVARFDAVTEAELDVLADALIERLLGDAGTRAPGAPIS
jgi:hypothetical protein